MYGQILGKNVLPSVRVLGLGWLIVQHDNEPTNQATRGAYTIDISRWRGLRGFWNSIQ